MRPLHEELADELLSLYKFFTALHIPKEALKVPPAGGWPDEVIRAHFEDGEKDEAVIKVLKHIPYIADVDGSDFRIWQNCRCNNFSRSPSGYGEPLEEQMDGCGWVALEDERGKYLATLGSCPGRDGWWIFCDVRSRDIIFVDFQMGIFTNGEAPGDFVKGVKDDFRELEAFPLSSEEICLAQDKQPEEMERIRDIFRKHGWPDEGFKRDECLSELSKL